MLGGLWVTVALAVAFLRPGGQDVRLGLLQANRPVRRSTRRAPVIPIWGYPPLLASFLIDNRIFQIGMVIVFGAWFLGWSGTLFLSSTRMIFAAAFDRVLPGGRRTRLRRAARPVGRPAADHGPVGRRQCGLRLLGAASSTLTLDASLVIAVMFFGTAIAATILPWWKPDLYQNSPIARYNILGVPLISVGGAVTGGRPGMGRSTSGWPTRPTGSASATPGSIIPGHPVRDRHRHVRGGLPVPAEPGR